MRLRAVELKAVDIPKAAAFLEQTWGLLEAGKRGETRFFRGTADHPYVLSLTPASSPGLEAITFAGSAEEIERLKTRVPGLAVNHLDVPGGGSGILIEGAEGQRYRFVT